MMSSSLHGSRERSGVQFRFIGVGLLLCFALFFFWQQPPASLLLLVVAACLAWIRIEVAIALLPLTFPYYLDLKPLTASGSPSFSLIELALFICLGVALLRNLLLPKERVSSWVWLHRLRSEARPFLLPGALFFIGATLAVLVSPDLHASLRAYRQEIIEPIIYLLLILRYVQTRIDLARAIGALLLSALIAAGMGIIQGLFHISSDLLYVNATTFRVNGPYGSPNNLAFLLDRTLPILLSLTFVGLFRGSSGKPFQSPAWRDPLRLVCLLLMIPLLWALYWTGSRGAELALGGVCFLLILFEARHWIVVTLALVIGGLGGWIFRARIGQFLNPSGHGVVSERLLLWKAGLLIIRDHLLLGTGPDSFNTLYKPTAPNSYALQALDGQPFPDSYNPHLSHPHNFVLDFWISTGLLGIAAFFWLLGAFAVVLRRAYLLCKPLREGSLLQRLLLGIAGSIIAMVAHGLVDNAYFLPDLAMLFWFFIGMLLVIQHIALHEGNDLRLL
ncbi:MAG TPA: O-antigen ligase family protein [Ktedonobacterales bacterium]|nr:O-antigen ligase family protein [Ktedonobacterales bacterium]